MKKLFTLFAALAFTIVAFAGTETTVYYLVPSSVVGTYTVKLNVNYKGDGDDWHQFTMVKGSTYSTCDLYSYTYTDAYNGVGKMQFQLYDGETYKSQQEPISSWTAVSEYNGKIYYHNVDWIDDVHDAINIKGSWSGSSWAAEEFVWSDNVGTFETILAADSWYNFGFDVFDKWKFYTGGNITESASNLTLTESNGSSAIHTTIAGTYKFVLNYASSTQKLSVTYPTGTTYTVGFSNPKNWDEVYAYVWNDEFGDKRITSAWPGELVSTSPSYTFSFESGLAPTKIVWNNGDDPGEVSNTKTGNLTFTNGTIYNMSTAVGSHVMASTPVVGKYYSTFYATYNVEIPVKDNADQDITIVAYTGEYNSTTSTLILHELSSPKNIIPGGQAVILKASTSAQYTLTPTLAAAGTAGTNNLVGVTTNTAVNSLGLGGNDQVCVLGVDNGIVGFYNFTGTLGANKAYLVVSSTNAPMIRFVEDEATDIKSIEANEVAVKFIENGKLLIRKNGVVYDMTGRVVR